MNYILKFTKSFNQSTLFIDCNRIAIASSLSRFLSYVECNFLNDYYGDMPILFHYYVFDYDYYVGRYFTNLISVAHVKFEKLNTNSDDAYGIFSYHDPKIDVEFKNITVCYNSIQNFNLVVGNRYTIVVSDR